MRSHAFIAKTAGAVAAVTIVLYEAWFMPFFQAFFAGRVTFARVVFYALYAALLLTSGAVLASRADVRRRIVPVAIVVGLIVAATLLHPIGLVTRSYIIALGIGATVLVLVLGSAPGAILRLTAAVTVLNVALCFVDLLFADGFTTTVGRAAGLAINPNDAAGAILLGAAASHRAVPKRFQLSFVVLALAGIAVTLSRSTMLAAVGAVALPVAVELWRRLKSRRSLWLTLEGVRPAAYVLLGVVAWVGVATVTNHRFRPVVMAVVADSLSFKDALLQAHASVQRQEQTEADDRAAGGIKADSPRMTALDARLTDEGRRNTISARTLFLERAMLMYRHISFFGMGLEQAHPLVPHNTFVLFALAFGHLGWLIPLALVGLTLYHAGDARDLPLAVAAVGTMATSHDILITPSLFLPMAIGVAGMLAWHQFSDAPAAETSVAAASIAGVALFGLGCVLIVAYTPAQTIQPLNPSTVTTFKGAYVTVLPPQTFPGVFEPVIADDPPDIGTFLREDEQPFERVALDSQARPVVAPGQFVVRDGYVIFAPADGSDPRTNGHALDIGYTHEVAAPLYALALTLVIWSVWVTAWLRPRPAAPSIAAALQAVP